VSNLARNPFVVLAAFVAIFWALLRFNASAADRVIGAVELTVILTISVLVVVHVLRRQEGTGGYSQDALMPPRLRRWILDERDDNRPRFP
jgi:amino acid permease